TSTCSSPEAAIATHRCAVPAPQSIPSGYWTTASWVRLTYCRASFVPCGMATPSPTNVDTAFSRSCIAATYGSSTAPRSTSRRPHCSIASARSFAVAPSRMASADSVSVLKVTAVPDRLLQLVEHRVAEEHREAQHRLVRLDRLGAGDQTLLAQHHVGVVRDLVHRRVLHLHRVRRQCRRQLAGQHDAAAHPGVARDDDLLDRGSVQSAHLRSVLLLSACRRPVRRPRPVPAIPEPSPRGRSPAVATPRGTTPALPPPRPPARRGVHPSASPP